MQTMTYVEEVGGFVNANDPVEEGPPTPYISDFPDVLIDLLGGDDVVRSAPKTGGDQAATQNQLTNAPTTPCRLIAPSLANDDTRYEFVLLRPADPALPVGNLEDGTVWNGTVSMKWDAVNRRYRSEPFVVNLARVVPVLMGAHVAHDHADVALNNLDDRTLKIRFHAIETTVANNGYCFVMASGLSNSQVIQGATDDSKNALRPKLNVDILENTRSLANFVFQPPSAVRILVGGNYAFYGPTVAGPSNYFDKIRYIGFEKLTELYRVFTEHEDIFAAEPADTQLLVQANRKFANYFTGSLFLQDHRDKMPEVVARNSTPGTAWYGNTQDYPSILTSTRITLLDGTLQECANNNNSGGPVIR
ncbi:MAG: hypothetical protein CMJ95_12820, partial [Planctomycetes bacterium]|nr:hypothetical protein [Planctomycetota bacterium]